VNEPGDARNLQGGGHLDEMTCLMYIERQLERVRAAEVSAHTQECAQCRTLLRALERESRLLTRALFEEDEPLPARLAEFQERARRSMQWIWGVVVGLAATGLYALYTTYVVPGQTELENAGFGGTNLVGLLIFQGAFWKGWQSVVTLLEVLALLTMAGFAMMIFRRRSRRGYVLAVLVATLLGGALLPGRAAATEFRKGEGTQRVAAEEVIHGDLYITGSRVQVDGTVEGDVFVFAQAADITGHVKGDVIAFVQSTRITGTVDGNVRAFTTSLFVSGKITRNILAFAEAINLEPASYVGGSVTTFTTNPTLYGEIGGDVMFFAKDSTIDGKIHGSVRARAGDLHIGSKAVVDGHVYFQGDEQPSVPAEAKLAYPIEFKKWEHESENSPRHYLWQGIWSAALILFGLVVFLLLPDFARQSVDNSERYGASFGLGILVLFGVPIAAVIACITVVGLFVGLSTLFLWYAALYVAQVVVGGLVGQWVLGRTREHWPLIGRMVLGLLLLRVCTAIPAVGGWIKFAIVVWGLGAISLSVYRRFAPATAPPGLPTAPSAPYIPPPLPPNTTVGGIQSA
jgi:cytoskeletal protein CcmA (bactofilin family)